MALQKIQEHKPKKIIDVSIIAIRITRSSTVESYHLIDSRPCVSCMYKIKTSVNMGYRVNKVYFSDTNGDIVCYKLRDIVKEKQFVSKFYRISNIPKVLIKEFTLMEIE